ncbi:MAG: hypothetical protein AAGB48_01750 [Planctomycetota bacterium]
MSSATALDPVKLLKKYLIVLIIAGFIGIAFGVGGFIALRRFAPQYKSEAFFQVLAERETISEFGSFGNKEELERFMATQANSMTSLNVLEGVVDSPRLMAEAPNWAGQFKDGGGGLNKSDALIELQETLIARPMSSTTYIQLSLSYSEKQDVFTIVDLVTDAYLDFARNQVNQGRSETRSQLNRLINDLRDAVERDQRAIDRLLIDNQLESVDSKLSEDAQALKLAVEDKNEVNSFISLSETQQKEYLNILNDPAGVTYPDDIRAQVNADPLIQQLQSQLQARQASLRGFERLGLGPEHPQIRVVRADIDGLQEELNAKTESLLSLRFDESIDAIRRTLTQLYARQAELQDDIEEATDRLNEITQIAQEIAALQRSVEATQRRIEDNQARLDELRGVSALESANRVQLFQAPTLPDRMSFPDIKIIVPAGFLLVMGFTSVIIVLRELLDQRVKGPSDIAMLPRTPVLGMLPDIAEDPSRPKRAETAFQDRPSGVFSESVRQLRTSMTKKIQLAGHRSVLIVPATPGSGATTLLTNVAQAAAAAESRVLIIDANLRRPALHRLFGLEAGPGLANVLGGHLPVEQAVRPTETPNLDVLTVGAQEYRVFERLSTEPMGRLLTELETRYDLVLIDVAPAIVAGDAYALANRVGGTVLVTRALSVKRGMVGRLKNELADTRAEFLGVVVNGVRASAGGYFKSNMRTAHAYHNAKRAAAEG